jgi:glycosyltransferase involved in cell wall biosynthesis
LVPQEDVDAIATCIMQLIDNPELALQIGKAARIRAVQSFDSHALAQMLTRFVASGDSCVQLDIESRVVD